MSASGLGSLIQAMVGSFGGGGVECADPAGGRYPRGLVVRRSRQLGVVKGLLVGRIVGGPSVSGVSLPSAAEVLRVQLRHAWLNSRRVLEGVTDDEYFWEPTSPCWSVRRRASAVRGWGSGEFVCEDASPPPDPLPTTTIAWRVIHLAAWTDIYRQFAFDGTRPDLNHVDVPADASGGLAWLHGAQDAFIADVDGLSTESVFEPRPAHCGETVPVVRLVTTMLTEHVHHIAEIGVLRDRRRGHALIQPQPSSLMSDPSWWTGTQSTHP